LPTRLPPDGGTLAPNEALFTAHQGYPEFVQTELTVQPDTAGIDVLHAGFALVSRGAPPTADASLAINWTPLTTMPALIGTTVDATVVTRPAVTWTTGAGTLASVTGVLVTALWTGTDPEGGFQRGSWTMVSPGTAQASLQAPTLPTALGAWAPIPASSFQISTVYAIDGGTALPGYAQLRATSSIFQLQTQCIFAPMAPALPLPGSLMMSGFTSGFCG
jgi:hypothetical protein